MLQRAFKTRQQATQTIAFPAPDRGWVQSGNIASAGRDQAEVLDNFFCTAQGVRLRGGSRQYADLSGVAVKRLFVYASGTEIMFAATDAAIYNASDIDGGSLRSTTSGDWTTTQISTAGGEFMVGVNGADTAWTYNGASFSDISLTGVTSSLLSQVWLFKERLFFVEKGTQSAWYLPVESIGGTVTEINLGSVFRKGGALLFGATWSLDSGSGLDDVCLFFSDLGEVAVYEGTDPDSASTWSLVGVYDIGQPINKHAAVRTGGDIAVITEDGIVPISEALRKDRAALQAVAVTYPIEDAWKDAVTDRSASATVPGVLWQAQSLFLVGTPAKDKNRPVVFAANARTGAWSRIIGWDMQCAAIYGDELYFGTSDGYVLKADAGGSDNGTEYVGVYVPKFATSDRLMRAIRAGVTIRANDNFALDLHAHGEYQVDDMPAPAPFEFTGGSTWGSGVWGTFVWGAGSATNTYTKWQTVRSRGYSLAPGLVITCNTSSTNSGSVALEGDSGLGLQDESGNALFSSGAATSINAGPKPDFQILMTRLRVETGYAL